MYAITSLLEGIVPSELVAKLIDYAAASRTVYHTEWLGDLWQRSGASTPSAFILHGWLECEDILKKLEVALQLPDHHIDPCELTGEGWIAEEALGTALLCFLLYSESPLDVVRRAAVTSGDSDSIACITGAFTGAYCGMDRWPETWRNRIEYRDRLETIVECVATG